MSIFYKLGRAIRHTIDDFKEHNVHAFVGMIGGLCYYLFICVFVYIIFEVTIGEGEGFVGLIHPWLAYFMCAYWGAKISKDKDFS